ncbi:MAG: hypothetical protein BWY74_01664 [Firmicutes bacterium ADurb.Bin419]|nr:MAG: hypothetical protein BWY74_01664 [Firmicutes bacterium ADurb.Bin419]
MSLKNKNIIVLFICVAVLIAGVILYFNYNNATEQIENNDEEGEIINNNEGEREQESEEELGENKDNTEIDITTKEGLLFLLDKYGKEEDFTNFAKYLTIVYVNEWDKDSLLESKESEIYMNVINKYFNKGEIEETLRISDIVYEKVPQSWRFRYLKIMAMERMGRDAFEIGDLATAEDIALKILQMMYRPEGANLLADVYIKKIENDIEKEDLNSARNNLYFIWDYEVSDDRREKLEEIRDSIL